MIYKTKFKKPKNKLEGGVIAEQAEIQDNLFITCLNCKKIIFLEDLTQNLYVCPVCNFHHKIGARNRINITADADSFVEHNKDLGSENILDFPEYDEKLSQAKESSKENEAVICGFCKIGGIDTGIFAMEASFMMGSMGSTAGDKITALFEAAMDKNLPVVGFTVSGGARMQEGILSLMQMAKVNAAIKRFGDKKLLYIPVLCNPTTGGVTASFAMCGDIILAEPSALICFAGPRVIEQTIRQKLPAGFQTAEFLKEKGFIDAIAERKNMKKFLSDVLRLHIKKRDIL